MSQKRLHLYLEGLKTFHQTDFQIIQLLKVKYYERFNLIGLETEINLRALY